MEPENFIKTMLTAWGPSNTNDTLSDEEFEKTLALLKEMENEPKPRGIGLVEALSIFENS